jgi:glutaredoxin
MTVTLFVVSDCPLCAEARAWLDQRGITYGELNVEADYSALRQMFKLTRQKLVPVLKVDEKVFVRPTKEEFDRLFTP